MKTVEEKEEAVKKAKCDLEAKRQKMEEDKAQQDPSDPESTTSSLTVSSGGNKDGVVSNEDNDAANNDNKRNFGEREDDGHVAKKPHLNSAESNLSTSSSLGAGEKGPDGMTTVNVDQTTMSVSDMTDSNKGSSNSGSDDTQGNNLMDTDTRTEGGTIDSDAAIVYGPDSHAASRTHSDVLVHDRKRNAHPSVIFKSFGRSFQLDYEEVFLRSNVPQLLATPQGRIIACKFFVNVFLIAFWYRIVLTLAYLFHRE
jgi:hypothetical protein